MKIVGIIVGTSVCTSVREEPTIMPTEMDMKIVFSRIRKKCRVPFLLNILVAVKKLFTVNFSNLSTRRTFFREFLCTKIRELAKKFAKFCVRKFAKIRELCKKPGCDPTFPTAPLLCVVFVSSKSQNRLAHTFFTTLVDPPPRSTYFFHPSCRSAGVEVRYLRRRSSSSWLSAHVSSRKRGVAMRCLAGVWTS